MATEKQSNLAGGWVFYVSDVYGEMPVYDMLNSYFIRASDGERLIHWVDATEARAYLDILSDEDEEQRVFALWRFEPERESDNRFPSPAGLIVALGLGGAPYFKAVAEEKIEEEDEWFTIVLPLIFNKGVPG